MVLSVQCFMYTVVCTLLSVHRYTELHFHCFCFNISIQCFFSFCEV